MVEDIHFGKVDDALNALRKFRDDEPLGDNSRQQLFEEPTNTLYLHINLKKVPVSLPGIRTVKINLIHPYISTKAITICLFVKDIDNDKWGPDVDKSARHYKEKLVWEKGVRCFHEVIALRQLKREYKTYEAKRKLCSAYDIFFADGAVQPLIVRNLGKAFYKAKKLPLSLDLSKNNIEKQVKMALESAHMVVKPTSTRCALKFGSLDQSNASLMENLTHIVDEFRTKLPGGIANIRSLHIATQTSPPLTFYVSTSTAAFVTLPAPQKRKGKPVVGEVTTIDSDDEEDLGSDLLDPGRKSKISSLVRVYPDGRVHLLDRAGQEIRSQLDHRTDRSPRLGDKVKQIGRSKHGRQLNRKKQRFRKRD